MPLSSPAERQQTDILLTGVYRDLESVYYATHEPQAYLSLVGNDEFDYSNFRFLSDADTTYVDEKEARETFDVLSDMASLAIEDTQLLLSDEWGVKDFDLILGDDPERTLTIYESVVDGKKYQTQLVEWDQPNPASGETARILYAAFQPEDMMQPLQTLIYINGNLLDARKRDQQTAVDEFDELRSRHLQPHMGEEAYEKLQEAIQYEINQIASSDTQDGTLLRTCVQMALMDINDLHPDAHHAILTSLDTVIAELAKIQADTASGRDLLTPDDAYLVERIVKRIPLRRMAS